MVTICLCYKIQTISLTESRERETIESDYFYLSRITAFSCKRLAEAGHKRKPRYVMQVHHCVDIGTVTARAYLASIVDSIAARQPHNQRH